jgi:protein-S-isoprenylcysteine O-methyltransferase Ste14
MTEAQRDSAGVIAHPPLIFLAFVLAGVALDRVAPFADARDFMADEWRYALAAVFFLCGLAVALAAFRQFSRAGTNIPTHRPTTALVTDGLYRYSRNPIYLALSSAHIAVALAAASPWALLFLVPALVVVRHGVIAREERYLAAKFGEDYARYRARVRRWL